MTAGRVLCVPVDVELLAVDPGVIHPAAARFHAGKLVAAARTPVLPAWRKLGNGQRALEIARAIQTWEYESNGYSTPTHIVIEWPQVYREAKAGKVDANDLTKILAVAMAVVGLYDTSLSAELTVSSPYPADVWDRLPKVTKGDPRESPRGARIWSRLDETEREVLELTHDAFDAAGLGLWALGRFERARAYPTE